jgi:hypothetical protein
MEILLRLIEATTALLFVLAILLAVIGVFFR